MASCARSVVQSWESQKDDCSGHVEGEQESAYGKGQAADVAGGDLEFYIGSALKGSLIHEFLFISVFKKDLFYSFERQK